MVDAVLNQPSVRLSTLKYTSLPSLIGRLAQAPINLLVVGKESCWVVNASTGHPGYFIGTRRMIGPYANLKASDLWTRLEQFTLRFTSPGALIKVFWLHSKENGPIHTSNFFKDDKTYIQLPGCTLEAKNGITLPGFVMHPIPQNMLCPSRLQCW